MSQTARRYFVVGVPGEISRDERERLSAADIRWKGSYDVLKNWDGEDQMDPWETRHVLRVAADDPDTATRSVAGALGRPDLVSRMDATAA